MTTSRLVVPFAFHYLSATLVVAALLTASFPALLVANEGSPLDEWTWRNPQPQGNTLDCAVHADGRYLVIGDNAILTSDDGRSWDVRRPEQWGAGPSCWALLHAEGRYFLSLRGEADDNRQLISEDGELWEPAGVPLDTVRAFAYGGGTFVAVDDVEIAHSTDGRSWSRAEVPLVPDALRGVTHGEQGFVAVGGRGIVLTSSDGRSWSRIPDPTDAELRDVAYGSGVYVAVGAGGIILRSSDAEQWRRVDSPTEAALHRIVYQGGRFVAAADDGALLTSDDGRRWRRVRSGVDVGLRDIAYDGEHYLAVGRYGALVLSPDARRWRPVSSSESYRAITGLAHDGRRVVAVGLDATVLTSADGGESWRARRVSTPHNLHAVIRAERQFVAVGEQGTVLTSPNGIGWAPRRAGTRENLYDVVHASGLYVAVGAVGTVLTSRDGRHWTARDSGTNATLRGITYGNGRFVTVGFEGPSGGVALTSRDGVNWEPAVRVLDEAGFEDIAFGNGVFVAVGPESNATGWAAVSDDGVSWRLTNLGTFLRGVTFGQGAFLAVSQGFFEASRLFSSVDGEDWQSHRSPSVADLRAARLVQDRFLVAGEGGAILQSAPYLAARPAFSVRGGTFRQAQHVTITTRTEGATIRYTTDGRLPSCTRGTEIASGAFVTLERDAVLQAVACAEGYGMSELRKETYRFRGHR